MRGTLALAAALAATLGACRAAEVDTEPGTRPAPRPPTTDAVPEGSFFDTVLDQGVGTRVSRVGERFTVTVSRPLVTEDGRVVVPEGAKIHGRITGLDDSRSIGEPALIRLSFEGMSFGGASYPFAADVVDTDASTEDSDQLASERAAVGAATGAALGAVIDGGLEATPVGGTLGAGTGTVISLGVGTLAPRLPAGSGLRLRTTRDLRLRPGR